MSRTRFAVYLVPPAGSAFYDLGSSVLGYDVRAGREVAQLPGLRPEWVAKAGQYGFHLTVVEALDCDAASFPEIEREIAAVCACFSPSARLRLSNGRTEVWDGGEVIVRRYDANDTLNILHALLTARLARFATGSSFEREVEADPDKYPRPYERARIELFRTPRGLDTWAPHFTLQEPYDGGNAPELAEDFEGRFESFEILDFGGVTLLRQDGGERYRVLRDFRVGAGA